MGRREPSVERLSFINHTECHCIDRHLPMHHQYNNSRQPQNHTIATNNNSTASTEVSTQSGMNNYSTINNNCRCVRHFKVFHERIESSDEDDELIRRDRPLCRCDCESENVSCDWLKKGKEGFSFEDRRCIVDRRCIRPTCEYGQYSIQIGRCPKLEDKLAGARNLFFD